jgi:hypothetical protein
MSRMLLNIAKRGTSHATILQDFSDELK